MAERKYVLTKIAAGDYLLPSNDGRTIWRVARYEEGETGPVPITDWPRDKEIWGYWKWTGSTLTALVNAVSVDVEGWSAWEFWDGCFETRTEAVRAALQEGVTG